MVLSLLTISNQTHIHTYIYICTYQISGNIVAPSKSAWIKKSADEWLYFHQVDGLNVLGDGLIDGRGESWWKDNDSDDSSRPTALRFSHCNNLQVSGLKHSNSQKNHISITDCNGATISHLQITAPQKSPNTDGIDISSSTNILIHDSVMATGDDCIAINAGTSNVFIANIECGPGHGISIGSLGKDGSYDEVEAIHVTNCTFKNTENGVRIKSWQGGSGFAKNITFSKITFIEADNPVIIDQYYCPHKKCANKVSKIHITFVFASYLQQTSAVKISDVTYTGLHGTSISTNATINFSCSEVVPCTNIILDDVHITSAYQKDSTSAHCINAQGKAHLVIPTVNCLSSI
ncbi:hypothetical protein RD792_015255 [Penstemon davidsonii]|uniref:Polygalacturonase n=1 Tax=Penstemon davidsonii TaxID=160366 RepID=A0ABR0CTR3_9LAMI|nr:hypothetical protein RD792_015255 [Penstemon davidsonii]